MFRTLRPWIWGEEGHSSDEGKRVRDLRLASHTIRVSSQPSSRLGPWYEGFLVEELTR